MLYKNVAQKKYVCVREAKIAPIVFVSRRNYAFGYVTVLLRNGSKASTWAFFPYSVAERCLENTLMCAITCPPSFAVKDYVIETEVRQCLAIGTFGNFQIDLIMDDDSPIIYVYCRAIPAIGASLLAYASVDGELRAGIYTLKDTKLEPVKELKMVGGEVSPPGELKLGAEAGTALLLKAETDETQLYVAIPVPDWAKDVIVGWDVLQGEIARKYFGGYVIYGYARSDRPVEVFVPMVVTEMPDLGPAYEMLKRYKKVTNWKKIAKVTAVMAGACIVTLGALHLVHHK